MGEFNSSVTRVWPVFEWLFRSDPTGTSWLGSLLRIGSRAEEAEPDLLADPGALCTELARVERALPVQLRKALGAEHTTRVGNIRNAFEAEVPPSALFLRWLLEHPEQLVWPKTASGQKRVYGPPTQENRERLLAGEPDARMQALNELKTVGAFGSRRKWWAFEGFTSVDCLLETRSLVLVIEGKRTELISNSTDWFPGRNQVVRNLEVAQALAGGRNFAVLVCAERPEELPEDAWMRSLPHFSHDEINELKRHYLGCATWSKVAEQLCGGLSLPKKLDDAIALCLALRSESGSI
jgi:hypothetical protein